MDKELKAMEKEKKLIPVMIKKYCKGKHKQERKAQGVKRDEVCAECRELNDYALFRLEKCPFKANKKFCSFCKIHCYKPDMQRKNKSGNEIFGTAYAVFSPRICFLSRRADDKVQKATEKGE